MIVQMFHFSNFRDVINGFKVEKLTVEATFVESCGFSRSHLSKSSRRQRNIAKDTKKVNVKTAPK
jgi:hypothetical protein